MFTQHRKILFAAAVALASLTMAPAAFADPTLYWMQLRADSKEVRTQIADTGVVIDTILEGKVYANGTAKELQKLKKLGLVEESFAMTPARIQSSTTTPNWSTPFKNWRPIIRIS